MFQLDIRQYRPKPCFGRFGPVRAVWRKDSDEPGADEVALSGLSNLSWEEIKELLGPVTGALSFMDELRLRSCVKGWITPPVAFKRGGDPGTPEGRQGIHPTPLAVHIFPRLPRKRDGDPGTLEGRQGVHPTPWQCTLSHACHAKEAETQGRQRDFRAYIQPLGSAHCPTPGTQKRRRARGTPGRTSNPLAMHIVPRLPRKRGGDPGTPEGL